MHDDVADCMCCSSSCLLPLLFFVVVSVVLTHTDVFKFILAALEITRRWCELFF
jgi:hypothetical protein